MTQTTSPAPPKTTAKTSYQVLKLVDVDPSTKAGMTVGGPQKITVSTKTVVTLENA